MTLHPDNPNGPARVFLTDANTVDQRPLCGIWIDPTDSVEALCEQIRQAGLDPDSVVVLDQIGMGRRMIDEDASLMEIRGQLR